MTSQKEASFGLANGSNSAWHSPFCHSRRILLPFESASRILAQLSPSKEIVNKKSGRGPPTTPTLRPRVLTPRSTSSTGEVNAGGLWITPAKLSIVGNGLKRGDLAGKNVTQ